MSRKIRTSRLHELHESKFPFVSRIEFIRSKLSNFSAHVHGVIVSMVGGGRSSRGHVVSLGESPQVGEAVQHPRVQEPGVVFSILPEHVAMNQARVVLLRETEVRVNRVGVVSS